MKTCQKFSASPDGICSSTGDLTWMPTLNTLEGSTEPFLFMEAEVFFSILHRFLQLFYLSHEESVLIFSSIICYYNNLPEKDKNIVKWVLYTYIKVTGTAPSDLQNLKQGDYLKAYSKVSTFLRDDKHIFWVEFRQLPSGRRIFVPICRTVRLLKSTMCEWILIIDKYEEVCWLWWGWMCNGSVEFAMFGFNLCFLNSSGIQEAASYLI